MNDLLECGSAPQPIAITRCRELLGDEALALSDEDIDKIRQHAQAMAHEVIDAFLQCGSSQGRER
jgi:hypothetical protein